MSAIISLSRVTFSYGSDAALALDGIDLEIDAGDFVGIIGPSGAGKSTLAAVLSGAIPHHHAGCLTGTVLVDGNDTRASCLTDISRTVGSVLQDIDAQMVASVVEDELLFGLENFGVAHDEIEERLTEALAEVGIAEMRHREIATLSGGQRQKVAIAAILALRPRVLVLDEPTAALDPISARAVFETVRDIGERTHAAIIVIEHNVALISTFCKRIVVLERGRVALRGTPNEVFAHGEELRRIGVDSPRVARISNSIAAAGLARAGSPALDVSAARTLIESVLAEHAKDRVQTVFPARVRREPAPAALQTSAAPPGEPILSFRSVCYTYAETKAFVRDLDFDVQAGEILAVIGRNGAGKTTLTKLICGLLRPQSGSVRLVGRDATNLAVSEIAGYVSTLFQNPDHQICKRTVLEEVAFGLELQGVSPQEARLRAAPVIERFGLSADAAPYALSRGTRQLVALASVVVMEPQVVLLDEPTCGLDCRERMTVMETVRAMASKGSAVVLVCHDMEVVSDFADRLLVMADGEIARIGPCPALFADRSTLERAGITPPQVIELSQTLVADGEMAFSDACEVSDVVSIVKELVGRA